MSSTRSLGLAFALLALPGCLNNFDPGLYMVDGGGGGGGDAGPTLAYADLCNAITPSIVPSGVTVFPIDTTSAADDMRSFGTCLDSATPGNDTFVAIDMLPNERWHFHVRQSAGSTVDPAIYILDDCNERACQASRSIDACGGGSNEHLSFVAPAAGGRFFVGVDSTEAGGFTGTLEVYRPICGNGTQEHSENCDDGNTMSGDGCDARCRAELSTPPLTEVGVNDDFYASNLITTVNGAVVLGDVGACDVDVFAVDLLVGTTLSVALTARGGGACPTTAPEMRLSLLATSGTLERIAAPLGQCPSFTFPVDAAGVHFVQVTSPDARPFDYDLRFTVTP